MKRKQGISLIVLVITIIVMIILAASVVITLSNTGIIDKANQAVSESNISTIQTAAQLAWSDAYLDGKRGTELIGAVETELLKADKDYKQKYNVTISDTGVNVTSKNGEWVTIYSGGGSIENGMLKIPNKHILNTKDKFRFTVESSEYTGTIEINKTITLEYIYLMAVVGDGNVITFDSIEDAESKMSLVDYEVDMLIGVNGYDDDNEVTYIAFTNDNLEPIIDKYVITKIEKLEQGTLVYSGNVTQGETIVLNNVNIINEFAVEYNGSPCMLQQKSDGYIVYTPNYQVVGGIYIDDSGKTVFVSAKENGVITIYSVGIYPNMVEENAYVARNSGEGWELVGWPSTMTTLPQTVAGKTITGILITSNNKVYYDREIDVNIEYDMDYFMYANIEVAPGVNPQKIFDCLLNRRNCSPMSSTLDLSALNVVSIPEEILEWLDCCGTPMTIYDKSSVKANYPQSYIVAK